MATATSTQRARAGRRDGGEETWAEIAVANGEASLSFRLVADRGAGSRGGPGWVEEIRGGEADGARRGVSAAEVHVLCEWAGRGEEAAKATEALAAALPDHGERGAAQAARLREELRQGRAGERVAAGPLRGFLGRALKRGGSLKAIAAEAGICEQGGARGDGTALLRRLGLKPHTGRGTVRTWSQTVAYEEAVAIARALDVDPFEVGV